MPKIGDVFSGGGKIGEVWSGDSGSGCGWIALIIVLFPIAIALLAFQGLWWIWQRESTVVVGIFLLPFGSFLFRFGREVRKEFPHSLSMTILTTVAGAISIVSVLMMAPVFNTLPFMKEKDHAIGTVFLIGLWVIIWAFVIFAPSKDEAN